MFNDNTFTSPPPPPNPHISYLRTYGRTDRQIKKSKFIGACLQHIVANVRKENMCGLLG